MKYYLGIDGGGTRTTAVASDESGKALVKSVGKSINFYSVGMEKARENLANVINDIYENIGEVEFEAAFIGCSALDDEASESVTASLCDGIIKAKKIGMNSDVYVALASSGEDKCRIVAICGTGSIATGIDENGILKTKGGWGHIFGDEGSAYSIAINALKASAMLYDEGKITPLVRKAEEFFKVEDFRLAIDKIYSPEVTKDALAKFSVKVGEVAQEDFVAKTVIVNEAHFFSKTVLALLNEMKNCTLVSLYGGVFQHNEFFRNAFIEDVKEFHPDLKIEMLILPPEEGALKIAREMQ